MSNKEGHRYTSPNLWPVPSKQHMIVLPLAGVPRGSDFDLGTQGGTEVANFARSSDGVRSFKALVFGAPDFESTTFVTNSRALRVFVAGKDCVSKSSAGAEFSGRSGIAGSAMFVCEHCSLTNLIYSGSMPTSSYYLTRPAA